MKAMGMETYDHILVGSLEASLEQVESGVTPVVIFNGATGSYSTVIMERFTVEMDGEQREAYVLSAGRHAFMDLPEVIRAVDLALADDDEG